MSQHLVIACHAGVDDRVINWVRFRIMEGVASFHVVVQQGDEASARLVWLLSQIKRLGASATGEEHQERPLRVLREALRSARFGGMFATGPGRFRRLRQRALRRLERRHEVSVVWIDPGPYWACSRTAMRRSRRAAWDSWPPEPAIRITWSCLASGSSN